MVSSVLASIVVLAYVLTVWRLSGIQYWVGGRPVLILWELTSVKEASFMGVEKLGWRGLCTSDEELVNFLVRCTQITLLRKSESNWIQREFSEQQSWNEIWKLTQFEWILTMEVSSVSFGSDVAVVECVPCAYSSCCFAAQGAFCSRWSAAPEAYCFCCSAATIASSSWCSSGGGELRHSCYFTFFAFPSLIFRYGWRWLILLLCWRWDGMTAFMLFQLLHLPLAIFRYGLFPLKKMAPTGF